MRGERRANGKRNDKTIASDTISTDPAQRIKCVFREQCEIYLTMIQSVQCVSTPMEAAVRYADRNEMHTYILYIFFFSRPIKRLSPRRERQKNLRLGRFSFGLVAFLRWMDITLSPRSFVHCARADTYLGLCDSRSMILLWLVNLPCLLLRLLLLPPPRWCGCYE